MSFVAGIAFASDLNNGLVNAFKSVGENIFGADYFSATEVMSESNDVEEVQLDYAPQAGVPIILNLFRRNSGGSCEAYVRLTIMEEGGLTVVRGIINPDVVPDGVRVVGILPGIINPDIYPPDPIKCFPPDPALPPDV